MTDKEIMAHWDDISRSMEQGEKSGAKITKVRMSKGLAEATYNLIKRLKRESNSYRNKAKVQKGEIRRLNARNNELNALNKTASIDAIKDFAERLKELPSVTNCEYEWLHLDIDNLVKEMVGDIPKLEHNSLCETETYEVK